MTPHRSSVARRRSFPRRPCVLGFLAGFLVPVPAVVLALRLLVAAVALVVGRGR